MKASKLIVCFVITFLLALSLLLSACRRNAVAPPSPEATLAAIREALNAGDQTKVFEMLDLQSRWSIMSIRKSYLKLCEMIKATYPAAQQARELERCKIIEGGVDDPVLLMHLDKQLGFFGGIRGNAAPTLRSESSGQVELEINGAKQAFCQEDSGYRYCGLRKQLEDAKIKSARDQQIVEENARAFRAGK